ncbi:hypothetical protein [Rhizobium sp. BK176]|uniref:hypothetical protein n=1 Tax=Rhizobium sp. BK176 TaxID=2587071 RepID=UPI00216808C6|nr:hypothetical protein [Rhizobium sp. BK176]MCS4089308.1 hypothetical protein [Rhizobium sp. BK176]
MSTELETSLAEIKFGYEIDEKTAGDMVDYAEDILKEHDALILALAKAKVLDRLTDAATNGNKLVIDADFVSRMQAEIGNEVGRILKPELGRRAVVERSQGPSFLR